MTVIEDYNDITWPDYGYQECMNCPNVRSKDDLIACIQCGLVLCEQCTYRIGMGDYCKHCCICAVCGNEALTFCELCSDLLCPEHSMDFRDLDDSTGYVSFGTKCSLGCR